MKLSRLLGTSAAAAVLVLSPTAALAQDYGGGPGGGDVAPGEGGLGPGGGNVAPGEGSQGAGGGGLPSTGSTALDSAIGGAGLALALGGGAFLIASRRRSPQPA